MSKRDRKQSKPIEINKFVSFFISDGSDLLENTKIFVDNQFIGYTNESGRLEYTCSADKQSIHVTIDHDDYELLEQDYSLPYNYLQVFIRPRKKEKPLHIPTHNEILNNGIRTNIAITDIQGQHSKWFTGAMPLWSEDEWNEWLEIAYSRDYNSIFFNLIMDYAPYGKFDISHDPERIIYLLKRCYKAGIVPWICLQIIDGDNRSDEIIAALSSVLEPIKEYVSAAFLGWETVVTSNDSGYTPENLLRAADITKQIIPNIIIGVQFWQPSDRLELLHYDGRGSIKDPIDWWKRAQIDVLLGELPYDYLEGDPNIIINEVGGVTCRIQGLFPNDGTNPNWQTDWGIHRKYCLFEYAAYLRWSDARKSDLRRKIQEKIPTIKSYGEG